MNEKVIINPPIKSLLFGIRSIGYSFSSAVADIIDNSISAFAKKIDIYADPLENEPYFQIIDDGVGMNKEELKNAITLGSNRDQKEESEMELGRFGMGLKMATLSQCRSLTVVSKKFGKKRAVLFDIDHIEETNKWEVLFLEDSEISLIPNIEKLEAFETGTIVMWKKFDTLELSSEDFSESFKKVVGEAKKHCEYVFHKFYDKIDFLFFGRKMDRRDPFLENFFPITQIGRESIIRIPNTEGEGIIRPYTLPYASQLTQEQKALLGNPNTIYDDQGFYIYRNKRLICYGSWLRMGIRSELNKHSRVSIEIPSSWDAIWALDIKKSNAKIPDILKDKIKIAVEDTIVKSQKITRGKGQKEGNSSSPIWFKVKYRDGNKYEINKENPLLSMIYENSDKETKKMLDIFLSQVESYLPQFRIISDSAESIHIYNKPEEIEVENLKEQLIQILKICKDPANSIDKYLEFEGFQMLRLKKQEILRELENE